MTSRAKNAVLKSQRQSEMEGVGDFFFSFFGKGGEGKGGTQGEGKRGYGRGFGEVMLEARPAETCRFGSEFGDKKKKG